LNTQNNQQQNQQQHPKQQPKRQQKPQQQQQHPQGRRRGQQQQRIGNQTSLNRHDFGQLIHPKRTKFNGQNRNIVPAYGNIIPNQSTNFQPIQGKSHTPPDIMMLVNTLQNVLVQQQQLLQLQQQRF